MPSENCNSYLHHDISDESDNDAGYDSEAAEISKVGRATKRRKINHTSSGEEAESETEQRLQANTVSVGDDADPVDEQDEGEGDDHDPEGTRDDLAITQMRKSPNAARKKENTTATARDKQKSTKKKAKEKETPPGVVYLSSLPPYLKPSALRNLLSQRGFVPITRLFLSPASKHKSSSKKNSRQLYTEGWIEFASKKTARRCSETLNAQVIGGKKGGFYHDDVWNMKYLRGMRWEELMAGVREEKREMEGRRDEERRNIMRDTKRFVEGVEEGRRIQGMKRKKESKAQSDRDAPDQPDVKRTWRQFDVKGNERPERRSKGNNRQDVISEDVKQVLGKIF
jgi:ESF2/ABP1 family protein